MICCAPFSSGATRKRGVRERLVPRASLRVRRRRVRAQQADSLVGVVRWNDARPRCVNSGRGRLSGRRSGSRRRTDTTDAPAASAFSHSVAAAIPAPRTSTSSAYSCGSYAWTARGSPSSSGGTRQPGMAEREQHVREALAAVELEAAVDGSHALDAPPHEALVPAGALAHVRGVLEELVDRRPVAVAGAQRERRRATPPPRRAHREPGERGRRDVPVALRAHPPLPDRARPRGPRLGRVGAVAEDDDLVRLEPSVTQRRVRAEAGEPASDDRDSHFTEPARSPWTK